MLNNHGTHRTSDTISLDSDVDIGDVVPPTIKKDANRALKVPSKDSKEKTPAVPVQNWDRRKSSVTMAKLEAINQLENTIKMADIIESKNDKISTLQTEVQSLKQQIKQSRQDLIESNRINRELLEKLQLVTDVNARQKIDLENLRTAAMANDVLEIPTNSDASYSRYLRDIIDNRETLIEENQRLTEMIDGQRQEIEKLNSYILQLEAGHNGDLIDYRYIDETTVEDRSKSDLLKMMRVVMDDKVVWMEYAIKLTHAAVAKCPDILAIDGNNQSLGNDNDNRWAQLAVLVMNKVSRWSPKILRDIVQSQDSEEMSYLNDQLK